MALDRLQLFAREFARVSSESKEVRAVFVGGSVASGTADDHSDLDLYVVAAAGRLESVCRAVPAMLATVGRLVFIRRVDHGFPMFVFVCADGTRGEIGVTEPAHLTDVHYGAYEVLFDRDRLLDGFVFPGWPLSEDQIRESLCRNLDWFWRSALNAAHYLRRGEIWPAAEELAAARRHAATWLRLRRRPPSAPVGGLYRLARELPPEELRLLAQTYSSLEIPKMTAGLTRLCTAMHAAAQGEPAVEDQRDRLSLFADLVRALVPFS